MPEQLAASIREIVTDALPELQALTEEQWDSRMRPGGWSRREEVGHLLDSAAHNRLRFARAALHGESRDAGYEQNAWVMLHNYAELDSNTLVGAWRYSNLVMAHLLDQLTPDSLEALCYIREDEPKTLRQIIESYLTHMQHHIDHVLGHA